MKHETRNTKLLNVIPSWTAAVEIYCAVLRNPDAKFAAVESAKLELLRLAQIVDNLTRNEK